MVGSEACDDGPALPCLNDCSGPSIGFLCKDNVCNPICGDGKVLGNEKCDAGFL